MTCRASATVCTRKRPARSCAACAPTSRPAPGGVCAGLFEPLRHRHRRASLRLRHVRKRTAIRQRAATATWRLHWTPPCTLRIPAQALCPSRTSALPTGESWPTLRRCCLLETYGEDIGGVPGRCVLAHLQAARHLSQQARRAPGVLLARGAAVRWAWIHHRPCIARQLDKHLPDEWTAPSPASTTTMGCLRCCPRGFAQRTVYGRGFALLDEEADPAEFSEKIGSMSYLQGIPTGERP